MPPRSVPKGTPAKITRALTVGDLGLTPTRTANHFKPNDAYSAARAGH